MTKSAITRLPTQWKNRVRRGNFSTRWPFRSSYASYCDAKKEARSSKCDLRSWKSWCSAKLFVSHRDVEQVDEERKGFASLSMYSRRNATREVRFALKNRIGRTESFKNLNRAIEDFHRFKISSDHRNRKYVLIRNFLQFLDRVARFLAFKIYFLWTCMCAYIYICKSYKFYKLQTSLGLSS